MIGYRLDRLAVLIIDDNQHMRSLVRTILESLGVTQIMEARDGAHALEKMSQTQIDLLIADWNMEPMDGLDLTRHLRTSPESPDQFVPVIMLSGHTERARVMQARDAGVTEFMAKPVSARSLYARIVSIIENPRPFVRTNDYFGPDRRRQMLPFEGPERRKGAGAESAKPGQPLTGEQQAALKRTKDTIRSMQKP
ncbi:MAG: response regulator [Alphaproteobacteria bacterium]|nr:response regulator [Alphaproteobacteria bacterium]